MHGLTINAGDNTGDLSPAQHRFNQLLARVAALTDQIAATRQAMDIHRPRQARELDERARRHRAALESMARLLNQRLRAKGLTAAQQRTLTDVVMALSEALAPHRTPPAPTRTHHRDPDDPVAPPGRSRHGDQTVRDNPPDQPLDGDATADDLDAALREMEEKAQAAQAQREAARAARRARKTTAMRQTRAQAEHTDAQSALRTLFRQLASALHPDRETDPDARQRKTALMSEANTAYQRRDLTALLQLQLRVRRIDSPGLARMAESGIAALERLLAEQVAALEHDLATLRAQARAEFGMAAQAAVNPTSLARTLAGHRQTLELAIAQTQRDLRRVQDDAEFRRWLKEQKLRVREVNTLDAP